MRLLTAAALVAALASPAAAGPLDALQYRATLRTDRPLTTGPASQPWETAYLLGDSPEFGVVVGNSSGWSGVGPAYPGAGFAVLGAGGLTPFTAAESLDELEVSGTGRYTLDLEFRDEAGRVAVVSLSGEFFAGWGWGHGYADLVFIPPDHQGSLGGPPRGSFQLGPTRYTVQLEYGAGGPNYVQDADGQWREAWYAADPVSFRHDGYWTEGTGSFYATLRPVETPEPSALVLAGIGAVGVWVTRRCRSHAVI